MRRVHRRGGRVRDQQRLVDRRPQPLHLRAGLVALAAERIAIASDVLNKYLQTELRRPLDADTLRTLVKSVDEWRPKTDRITRPTRSTAPPKAPAKKSPARKKS